MTKDQMISCHYCEEEVDETCECFRCGQQTCEDCFTPMAHNATDPVTDCLECSYKAERAFQAQNDAEVKREAEAKARREEANRKARDAYWKPENVMKRRVAAYVKRLKEAEEAQERMRQSVKIVSEWLR